MRSSNCVGGIGVSGCCECMDHRTCASAGRQGILVRVCFRPARKKSASFFLGSCAQYGLPTSMHDEFELKFRVRVWSWPSSQKQ